MSSLDESGVTKTYLRTCLTLLCWEGSLLQLDFFDFFVCRIALLIARYRMKSLLGAPLVILVLVFSHGAKKMRRHLDRQL